jgi:hypothetical protein
MRVLLLLVPAVGIAAELLPINDLRIGVDYSLAPEIEERVATTTHRADYDWVDNRGLTRRVQIEYANGMHRRGVAQPGFLWTLGLFWSETDIRPRSFEQHGGGAVANVRKRLALDYHQYGAAVGAGWATRPHITEYGEYTWEFLPVVRGGYARAATPDGSLARTKTGDGSFWEVGGQIGWTLQDAGWLLNLHGGWVYGQAEVPVRITGGTSDLVIRRNVPEVGLSIGVRF